ncbi:MAG: hypothetical protein LBF78_12025 [Treponema sp.]|jgi:electron transport complex protein RnfA|nr:hypothetical protein [Treponema sp.]
MTADHVSIAASLALFAGLSFNLMLHFALGIGGAALGGPKLNKIPLFQLFVLFLSVFILWIFCRYFLNFLSGGFLEYFLIFPLSVLACMGLEALGKKLFPKQEPVRVFSASTSYDGLALVSLILTLRLALNIRDALILSFFFAAGCFVSAFILREIRRRSFLERVPRFLKGVPLLLISMGLLSMIFAAAGWICFQVLENL